MTLDELVANCLAHQIFAEVVLSDKAIVGIEESGPLRGLFDQHLLRHRLPTENSGLQRGTVTLLDQGYIRPIGTRWSFANNCSEVGVNPLAVQCYRECLADIFSVVCNYYLREPVRIGHWEVPVYQQPSWDLQLARACILHAEHRSAEDMTDLLRACSVARAERPARYRRVAGQVLPFYELLPTVDDLLYLYIPTRTIRGNPHLYLRADLQEAFVVDEVNQWLEFGSSSMFDLQFERRRREAFGGAKVNGM